MWQKPDRSFKSGTGITSALSSLWQCVRRKQNGCTVHCVAAGGSGSSWSSALSEAARGMERGMLMSV